MSLCVIHKKNSAFTMRLIWQRLNPNLNSPILYLCLLFEFCGYCPVCNLSVVCLICSYWMCLCVFLTNGIIKHHWEFQVNEEGWFEAIFDKVLPRIKLFNLIKPNWPQNTQYCRYIVVKKYHKERVKFQPVCSCRVQARGLDSRQESFHKTSVRVRGK